MNSDTEFEDLTGEEALNVLTELNDRAPGTQDADLTTRAQNLSGQRVPDPMQTGCTSSQPGGVVPGRRRVIGNSGGGGMTSGSSALLLREADRLVDVTGRFAACSFDYRPPHERPVANPVDNVRNPSSMLSVGLEPGSSMQIHGGEERRETAPDDNRPPKTPYRGNHRIWRDSLYQSIGSCPMGVGLIPVVDVRVVLNGPIAVTGESFREKKSNVRG